MRFLVIYAWNGQEHAALTDAPSRPSGSPTLAHEIERYELDEPMTLSEARQAREFAMLRPYAPPVRNVPWQAMRFGLDETATQEQAQAVYDRLAPTVPRYVRTLMEVALRRWPVPTSAG